MPYLTVGDPDRARTVEFAVAMIDAGADLIELGIPFSDPTADGPVIQAAMVRAMAEPGFSLQSVFATMEQIHQARPEMPLVVLTYANPVLSGLSTEGAERSARAFLTQAHRCGVRGVVIPDLPFDSPEGVMLRSVSAESGIDSILMVAPNTSEERMRRICASARGFIYYVTSLGVTGLRRELPPELEQRVALVRKLAGVPVLAGFGFSQPEQGRALAGILDGIIVGSLNHRIISEHGAQAAAALAQITREFRAASRLSAVAPGPEKEL